MGYVEIIGPQNDGVHIENDSMLVGSFMYCDVCQKKQFDFGGLMIYEVSEEVGLNGQALLWICRECRRESASN
jgi:hypothetical protein